MIAALLGLASAFGLGVADFMARFSARALGAPLTYGAVLLVGAIGTTIWVVATGATFVWSPIGCTIAIVHGVSVSVMCILLYMGLARGPIAVVAPIVASHSALVLVVSVFMGVRPSALQWAAMAAVIAGAVLITRVAVSEPGDSQAQSNRTTIVIAFGACIAYATLILTGQAATPLIGETQTVWIGRWSGLVFIVLVLIMQRAPLRVPSQWLPFMGAQGSLDTLGYFTLLAGASTSAPYVTVVVASGFSVVTVLLAWLIIREPISKTQWGAIGLIATGTATLSAT